MSLTRSSLLGGVWPDTNSGDLHAGWYVDGTSGSSDTSVLIASFLGCVEYLQAWELQKSLHRRVVAGELPDSLILLEHPHTYTLGRRGGASDIIVGPDVLAEKGVAVHHVDRGGEATYHGPGQIVGYPIVNLRSLGCGPFEYVRALERVLVATLAEFGIAGESAERPTGVWVGNAKIAAIGVKVSRGVTTHGFALNVDPDLSYFDHIVPCGIPGGRVTSMSTQRPGAADVHSVVPVLSRHFGRVFGRTVEWGALQDLGVETAPLSPVPS